MTRSERPGMRKHVARGIALLAMMTACAAPRARTPAPADEAAVAPIRVLLAQNVSSAEIVATGAWFLLDPQRRLIARVGSGERWAIERSGDKIRAVKGSVRSG